MSTYRTGNHWGVTIVCEGDRPTAAELGDCAFCCIGGTGCPIHPAPNAELVAVVVNGDQELAEDICYRLNAPTLDVPYTNGAREALAEVRRRLKRQYPGLADVAERILRDAAAELGVDEDAPRSPLSATETAQTPSAQGSPRAEGAETVEELAARIVRMGYEVTITPFPQWERDYLAGEGA